MAEVSLIINGVYADLPPGRDFAAKVFRKLLNFKNATDRYGDHTMTITLPHSKKNDLLFKNLQEPDAIRKFSTLSEFRCDLRSRDVSVLRGGALVQRVHLGGIDIVLYSDNVAWAQIMGTKKLRDLTTLGSIHFIGSRSWYPPIEPADSLTQPDIWAMGQDESTVQFPLVSYGNYFKSSIAKGEEANDIHNVQWQDVPPSFFIIPIIRACFAESGFTLAGDIWSDEDILKLIMPYVGDIEPLWNWRTLARAAANSGLETYTYAIGLPDDTDFGLSAPGGAIMAGWNLRTGTEAWDYSNSYFVTAPKEQYVVPVTGEYGFTIQILNTFVLVKGMAGGFPPGVPVPDYERTAIAIVRIPDDTDELDELKFNLAEYIGDGAINSVSDPNIIAFYDFGLGYTESPMTLNAVGTGGTYAQVNTIGVNISGSGSVQMWIDDAQLSRGDRVEVWIMTQGPGANPLTGTQFTDLQYYFTVTESTHPVRMDIAANLPDITQLDFIKSMIVALNLYFSVDTERRIIWFEPRDDFYRPTKDAIDWTGKGTIRTASIKPVPFYKKSTLKWADDQNDYYLKKYGSTYFEHSEENESAYAIQESEVISVTSFAPTFERRYRFRNAGLVGGRPWADYLFIPTIAGEEAINTPQEDTQWSYAYAPRLLKYIGMQPAAWRYDSGGLATYPAARFSFDETGGKVLAFGDDAQVVAGINTLYMTGNINIPTASNIGLYRACWSRFFWERLNSHLVEALVKLSERDFAAAETAFPVIFGGNVYYLYSFSDGFDPISQDPMRVELMRVL